MNTRDFLRLGVPLGEATRRATDFVAQYALSGGDKSKIEDEVKAVIANPRCRYAILHFIHSAIRRRKGASAQAKPAQSDDLKSRRRGWGRRKCRFSRTTEGAADYSRIFWWNGVPHVHER